MACNETIFVSVCESLTRLPMHCTPWFIAACSALSLKLKNLYVYHFLNSHQAVNINMRKENVDVVGDKPVKNDTWEMSMSEEAKHLPGRVAQSVTCLATDVCLTADPGPVPYFHGD